MTLGALRVSALALGAAALVLSSPLSAASAATVVIIISTSPLSHAVHGRVTHAPRGAHGTSHMATQAIATTFGETDIATLTWLQSRRRRRGRSDWRQLGAGYPYSCDYAYCGGYGYATTATMPTTADYGPYYGGFGFGTPASAMVAALAIGHGFHGNGAQFAGGNFGHGGSAAATSAGSAAATPAALAAVTLAALAAATWAALAAAIWRWRRRALPLTRGFASPSASGGPSGRPILFGQTAWVEASSRVNRATFGLIASCWGTVGRRACFLEQEGPSRPLHRSNEGGHDDLQRSSHFGHRARRGRFGVVVCSFRRPRGLRFGARADAKHDRACASDKRADARAYVHRGRAVTE